MNPTFPLEPMPGHVFILADEARTVSAGGLHMVEDWNPDLTGRVVAVCGNRCDHCGKGQDPPFTVGDRVMYPYTAGSAITFKGTEFLSMLLSDVMLKWEDTDG